MKEERTDFAESALAYTAEENKVEEIDLAIEVDGLCCVFKSQCCEGDEGDGMGQTCGRQHTAPMIVVKARCW